MVEFRNGLTEAHPARAPLLPAVWRQPETDWLLPVPLRRVRDRARPGAASRIRASEAEPVRRSPAPHIARSLCRAPRGPVGSRAGWYRQLSRCTDRIYTTDREDCLLLGKRRRIRCTCGKSPSAPVLGDADASGRAVCTWLHSSNAKDAPPSPGTGRRDHGGAVGRIRSPAAGTGGRDHPRCRGWSSGGIAPELVVWAGQPTSRLMRQ
jgi:hypothetical protein